MNPGQSNHQHPSRRSAWTRAAFALVCGQAIALGGVAHAQVKFRSGADGLAAKMAPEALKAEVDRLSGREAQKRVLVQFERPVDDADREQLAGAGVRLLGYLGDNSWFATLEPGAADGAALGAMPSLRGVAEIKPRWKTHPQFLADEIPQWAVVEWGAPQAGKADPVIGVYVMFHEDAPIGQRVENLAAGHGAVVRDRVKSINTLVLEMPMSRVAGLAAEDDVLWIEPALPKMVELNDSNRNITQANVVQAAPYALDGTGVKALVYDGGRARATHQDFGGRLTTHDDSSVSDHATHVAGTVGGSGAASGGLRKGMAPGVTIVSYGFQYDGTPTFLYNNPGDIEADYGQAINTHNADISNNSIGTNTAPNGFPCSYEGDYSVTDALIDAIVRGSLGRPFRIVWANGNERQGSARCGSTYFTTAPPACAKNHITVGALNSNNDSVTSFTSWGPTDDGRLKPDIAAPGCESGSDGGVTSAGSASDTAYSSKCGTSMAAPTVTGLAALLLQDYRANYPSAADPRNSTLKILFAHTAQDIQNPGPDYQTGYGSVRIQAAVDLQRSGHFLEAEVGQGGTHSVLVVVQAGDPQFKATLAWDDAPGVPLTVPNLVNNLDLVVIDPNGVRHYPWTLDPANPGNPAVRTQPDTRNNIEQVLVDNPVPGVWRVDVVGTVVPVGPQTFSVAATPFLVNCSTRGVASIQRQQYACESTVNLRVVDCDLNTDDNTVDTVQVVVNSTTDPAGELVTLVETGPQTATFDAQMPLSATAGPGVVQVSNGDTLTLTYIDADDGFGGVNVPSVSNATIDCVAPVISMVQATNVQPRTATISYLTDDPAASSIQLGTSCGSGDTVNGPAQATVHTINLTGLQDATGYAFSVTATDTAGNVAVADNAGACFAFVTPDIPNFFTEQFSSSDNDLDNRRILWTPAPGVDRYFACSEPISILPTDPAGGTAFTWTGDNQSLPIDLTGGATVKLYGVSYPRVYVGTNGYLTFTTTDTDSTESLADHFDTPRVSALFDDLDPNQQGQVSWKQLEDRLVVTYLNVTQDTTTSDSNTFQIEMYFDGRIAISYLAIAAPDGVAGLSNGGGVSPDYFETDLSSFGACGPRPPTAQSTTTGTPVNTPLDMSLVAADDGLPGGTLDFTVLSLPTHGTLFQEGGPAITSTPFTIPGGGSAVRYVPSFNYVGPDGFTFKASDGGVAPDGGDSNIASVAISVGVPALVYSFNFDTDPRWARDNDWQFGQPTGGGTRNRDPLSGFTGTNVYGYNLAGDYPNNLAPTRWLTTTAIDCSELTQTRLEFRRWLGIESSTFDKAYVAISTDGTTWTNLWTHSGAAISETAWSLQVVNISAIADNQPTVYIRWGIGPTDGSVTYPGWNIDDVQIFGVQPLPSGGGPDLDGDGDVDAADLASLLGAWGPCPAVCPADFNGDGQVGAADLAALLGAWAPTSGSVVAR